MSAWFQPESPFIFRESWDRDRTYFASLWLESSAGMTVESLYELTEFGGDHEKYIEQILAKFKAVRAQP